MSSTARSARRNWFRQLVFATAFSLVSLSSVLRSMPAHAGVNVNTASVADLESLPGIGPSKAAAIVAYRTEHGAFTSVESLQAVPGIGAKTVESLRADAEVGDGATVMKGASTGAASGAPSANAVNINTASTAQLDTMPGIGPSKAAAIVADRDAKGPFSSCDDLTRVTGVGAKTVSNLRAMCTTGE